MRAVVQLSELGDLLIVCARRHTAQVNKSIGKYQSPQRRSRPYDTLTPLAFPNPARLFHILRGTPREKLPGEFSSYPIYSVTFDVTPRRETLAEASRPVTGSRLPRSPVPGPWSLVPARDWRMGVRPRPDAGGRRTPGGKTS